MAQFSFLGSFCLTLLGVTEVFLMLSKGYVSLDLTNIALVSVLVSSPPFQLLCFSTFLLAVVVVASTEKVGKY